MDKCWQDVCGWNILGGLMDRCREGWWMLGG
jgi:hypothetical protein